MILTRSPYYFNVVFTNTFVTHVDFTIQVGTGLTSSITVLREYLTTKQKPSSTSLNTWVDISPFVRDLYGYQTIQTNAYAVPTILNNNEALAASISAKQIDSLGSKIPSTKEEMTCTDGYGYYTEGQNKPVIKKILLAHTNYKADEKGFFIVPLRCSGLSPDPVVDGVAVDLNYNAGVDNHVKYIVIPMAPYTDGLDVSFDGESIHIELIEECKYPVSEIQFINRYGVLELIHFYKATQETIKTQSETFKNAHTNGTAYDIQRHQIKEYNKTSRKEIKIETGYLNPNYNETIQELMQSEFVWIKGNPVNVVSTSLEFKTRIVDKLISYSLNFEHAYDEINNV